MDIIDKKEFEKTKVIKSKKEDFGFDKLTEEEFKQCIDDMQNPVMAQKRIAAQIKIFLDERVKYEMKNKGFLSDHTRRWVDTYNSILEKLQKAIYGDKSVNLHLHKVTHAQIAARMRTLKPIEVEQC